MFLGLVMILSLLMLTDFVVAVTVAKKCKSSSLRLKLTSNMRCISYPDSP